MEYFFKSSALNDLKKLPSAVQSRILQKLDFYTHSDNPLGSAESLRDPGLGDFRFRIGDYRAIFDLDKKQNAIIILKVGHRKDIYR